MPGWRTRRRSSSERRRPPRRRISHRMQIFGLVEGSFWNEIYQTLTDGVLLEPLRAMEIAQLTVRTRQGRRVPGNEG